MGIIHISAGAVAREPYFFDKMQADIFTLEELSFCVSCSARFLDKSFPDHRLIRWIDRELKLPGLAGMLRPGSENGDSDNTVFSSRLILEYAGLMNAEEIDETVNAISDNLNLSIEKKRLSAADHILKQGRYYIARRLYDVLYNSLPEENREDRALCLRGSGRCYALFFFYDEAAEHFMKAYEIMGDEEDMILYLSAMRLYLDDDEYLDLLAENPDYYKYSMEAEKRIRLSTERFEASEENERLQDIINHRVSKRGDSFGEYRELLENEMNELKRDYREKAVWD